MKVNTNKYSLNLAYCKIHSTTVSNVITKKATLLLLTMIIIMILIIVVAVVVILIIIMILIIVVAVVVILIIILIIIIVVVLIIITTTIIIVVVVIIICHTAPDVNSGPREMAWIFDEYSKLHGFSPSVGKYNYKLFYFILIYSYIIIYNNDSISKNFNV